MNCFPKQRFTPYTGRISVPPQPQPPSAPPAPVQYPLAPDLSGHSLNQQVPSIASSSYHNTSSLLNASASSFNVSRSDLDSSVGGECAESLQHQQGKLHEGNTSGSSLANLSGSSGGRNDSGIGGGGGGGGSGLGLDLQKKVTLQLNNLDSSYDESALKKFLISLLKPITPIVSLVIDGASSAKIEVPSPHVSSFPCLAPRTLIRDLVAVTPFHNHV